MPKISRIDITSPPNSLFEGITTNTQNNLTYAEFLLGILKKLDEMIITVNEHSEFIDKYSGEIEEMQRELAEFRAEWEAFKIDIEASLSNQILAFKQEVYARLTAELTQMRSYIDVQDDALRAYIDQVAIGQIMIYNPVTGIKEDLQTVINSLYEESREDALTATEYDALDLSASAYEAYDLTASEYDTSGKTLLV